ncbi:hypothetical protein [Paenibacillus sp. GCM10028914]|uniref:hypothetical protein n=1 Tax=Paenibacillus sp. GCM10028914 TaxID=3273416 RepID=UPI00361ED791
MKEVFSSIQKGYVIELCTTSSKEELQEAIYESLSHCNVELLDEIPKLTSLEQHLCIKGWKKATKDKKCVSILLNPDGFSISPMNKHPRYGYLGSDEIDIHLNVEDAMVSNNLARAVIQAINLSSL